MLTVKLSRCLTKQHAMEAYLESGGIASRILNFGARKSEFVEGIQAVQDKKHCQALVNAILSLGLP